MPGWDGLEFLVLSSEFRVALLRDPDSELRTKNSELRIPDSGTVIVFTMPMKAIKTKFKKATATPKGRIILSSILFVLILGVIGAVVYWQTHKKMIIREKLESAIHDKSGGFYTIKYDNLELDEINGYLAMSNLAITYDSVKFEALADLEIIPPVLFNIRIPEIAINGVKTPRALIDKEIDGQKLEIKNPVIEIIYTMKGKDSARHVPTSDIYRQILGNFNQISVDTVIISGAQITTRNLKTKQTGIEVNNVLVQLVDVLIDSTANADTTRLLFAKQINVNCENITWQSDNKLYKYQVKDVVLNSTDNTASVSNFTIDPQAGEDAFMKSIPTQDDRFDFSFRNIRLKNIGFTQLLEEEIVADSMLIGSASFKIYRDLNIPRDKKNRVGTYPQQVIGKLPVPVHVKQLILSNAFLEYKERSNITKQAGKVQFHNVYATISNLTNKKDIIANDNTMNASINSLFMNKAPFKVSWVFYLGNSNGRFNLKGSLGAIHANDLNALTEAMGPARIENGEIKGLNFNFAGNDYSMNGSLQLVYDDLKVAMLEKDKDSKEWDKKSLTSFVANIMIKNSNPKDKDDPPRSVSVTNERDTNRSIFNVAWKTIFKGIKETVGIKK
jgi:hypothetical protein